jgi:hypothetical protein
MLKRCLSCQEIDDLIRVELGNGTSLAELDVELSGLFDMSRSWEAELICLSLLLARSLERLQKTAIDVPKLLANFYELSNSGKLFLTIDEVDATFVDYMLSSFRSSTLNLEEELIDLRHRLGEYEYPR